MHDEWGNFMEKRGNSESNKRILQSLYASKPNKETIKPKRRFGGKLGNNSKELEMAIKLIKSISKKAFDIQEHLSNYPYHR